jgi:hypothetical protein
MTTGPIISGNIVNKETNDTLKNLSERVTLLESIIRGDNEVVSTLRAEVEAIWHILRRRKGVRKISLRQLGTVELIKELERRLSNKE